MSDDSVQSRQAAGASRRQSPTRDDCGEDRRPAVPAGLSPPPVAVSSSSAPDVTPERSSQRAPTPSHHSRPPPRSSSPSRRPSVPVKCSCDWGGGPSFHSPTHLRPSVPPLPPLSSLSLPVPPCSFAVSCRSRPGRRKTTAGEPGLSGPRAPKATRAANDPQGSPRVHQTTATSRDTQLNVFREHSHQQSFAAQHRNVCL